MNQFVAKETLKGLLHAPVPACSCAKGLAVGAVQAWDALQELASMCGLSHSNRADATSSHERPILQSSASSSSQAPAAVDQIAASAVPAVQPRAVVQSGPPELLSEANGLTGQHHAVYMQTMMLHGDGRPY
jgi:hypothetical protein